MSTLGDKIRILRKNKELTQVQLAKLLNVSDDTVQKWEVGKNTPPLEWLKQLAIVFDTTDKFLIDDAVNAMEYRFLYKTDDHDYFPDSAHVVYDANLRKNGKLHRFKNKAGVPYSAIYRGSFEAYSCERSQEKKMLDC